VTLEAVREFRPDAVDVTLEVPPAPPVGPLTPGSSSGPLPFTGAELGVLLMVAVMLIIAGVLILTILRKRPEPSHA
jgi:hypothetical protein